MPGTLYPDIFCWSCLLVTASSHSNDAAKWDLNAVSAAWMELPDKLSLKARVYAHIKATLNNIIMLNALACLYERNLLHSLVDVISDTPSGINGDLRTVVDVLTVT